jgi:hypothetical protein
MRREWHVTVVAVAALAIGVVAAEPYARLAAPYYAFVARLFAHGHPWEVLDVIVGKDETGQVTVLRLDAIVRRMRDDPAPAAIVNSGLHLGAVAQNPVIFWSVLLLWPVRLIGPRWRVLLVGAPLFLGLEAVTTVCQLLNPLADASAVLAGDAVPFTAWEGWSRFLESGGRFALALGAGLLTLAAAAALQWRHQRMLSATSTKL